MNKSESVWEKTNNPWIVALGIFVVVFVLYSLVTAVVGTLNLTRALLFAIIFAVLYFGFRSFMNLILKEG